MNDNNAIGIITEQGDLGLGFEPINEKEQSILNKKDKKKDEEDN